MNHYHFFLKLLTVLFVLASPGMLLGAYAPPGMGLDAWFIKTGDTWHQFQLCGPYPDTLDKVWAELPAEQAGRKPSTHVEQGIYHSTSKDLIAWHDEGVVLTLGAPGQWDDGAIYTGNIAKHGDTFYLFYTGLPAEPKPGQMPSLIGVATSKDLVKWVKNPDNPILRPDPKFYDPMGNWRDCNFYWDDRAKTWYAVICASAAGAGVLEGRACIGLAQSPDLLHWTCLPPLASSARFRLGLENPFLFPHGGKWYLGHSMYSQFFDKDWLVAHPGEPATGGAFYFTADQMTGPYRAPDNPGLGTQPDPPPYAVQMVKNGDEYLFMHRGPGRWATALPKKVDFRPDGGMRLVYWPDTEKARKESLLAAGMAGNAANAGKKSASLEVATSQTVVLGRPGLFCFFEATVNVAESGAAGLRLGETLLLVADRSAGKIFLADPVTRKPREDRMAGVDLGRPVRLRLVADGSVVDVYADDVWLFAEQRGEPKVDEARIECLRGAAVKFGEVRLDRLVTGNRIDRYGFNY